MEDRTGQLEGNRTLGDVVGGGIYRTWPGSRGPALIPQPPMQEPNYAPAQAIPGWAMPEAAGMAGAEPNAPRLMENGGQWTLFEHGNQRPLQPHEVGSSQNYVSDFWNAFGNRGGQVWGSGTANDPYAQQSMSPPGPAMMSQPMGGGYMAPQTWGWGGRNANRTLGELTNQQGTDSSYGGLVR